MLITSDKTIVRVTEGDKTVSIRVNTDREVIVTSPLLQGAKGDALTLTAKNGVDTFEDVDTIEIGDNIELTQTSANSVIISAQPSGIDFYTHEMDGLASTFTAEHNLGRFIAVARVYQPDGEVAQVEVQNKDNAGNVSKNVAQVISSVPMLGTLTLI